MTLLRHKELEIPKGNPFEYCKLHRRQYGEILKDIVGTYADGFVLAIDNKWGTGKTTFIKMWQRHLEDHEFNTIYFNAWEHDFDNKPLAAILGELKALENPNEPVSFQQLTQAAASLLKGITPLLLKGLAKYLGGGPIAQEIIETASTSYKDILTEEIDDYLERKRGLEKFKKALEKYVSDNCGEKPLIFIIDELDRCRPDYAVQVLEQVKHFFSVPGIVFVLAIDKQQLGNAIKGFYGTDSIDSNEYLRRFIDVEFTLPQPEVKDYWCYLFGYYGRTNHYIWIRLVDS
jgi:predicted KAP-like P-loop ATPase